ncbi:NeuD/PglB/VioB family sugar acetyltransferase, partial [Priestia sp. BR_2]
IINGYRVLCSIEDFIETNKDMKIDAVIISIGDNVIRKRIINQLSELNLKYRNAIHPNAIISDSAKIGEGVLINAGAIIQADAVINNHCNIGTGAVIDHECFIEDYVNIAPNATLCGKVYVSELCVVGPNSVILEKCIIEAKSIIGAGAVVVKDVQEEGIFIGVPAKFLKKRDGKKSYLK